VKGAYAALLSDEYSAERARMSNDANIACFGAFYHWHQSDGAPG
jgi:ribose 5-phosphate isomerase B